MISFIATEMFSNNHKNGKTPNAAWFCVHVRGEREFEIHRYVDDIAPGVYKVPRCGLTSLPTTNDDPFFESEFMKTAAAGMVVVIYDHQQMEIMSEADCNLLMNL